MRAHTRPKVSCEGMRARQIQKGFQPRLFRVAKRLDVYPSFCPTEDVRQHAREYQITRASISGRLLVGTWNASGRPTLQVTLGH